MSVLIYNKPSRCSDSNHVDIAFIDEIIDAMEPKIMCDLSIYSQNVWGLRDNVKRHQIFHLVQTIKGRYCVSTRGSLY